MTTRQVSWGHALVVQAYESPGGLKLAVDVIRHEVGSTIGVRGSFSKLLDVEGPDDLSQIDKWRAWLLLAAFGEEPNEWGVSDAVIPPAFNARALRKSLPTAVHQWGRLSTRWSAHRRPGGVFAPLAQVA